MRTIVLLLAAWLFVQFCRAQTSLDPTLVTGCKGAWSFDDAADPWADGTVYNHPLVPMGAAPTAIAGPLPGDGAMALPAAAVGNYVDMNADLPVNSGRRRRGFTHHLAQGGDPCLR